MRDLVFYTQPYKVGTYSIGKGGEYNSLRYCWDRAIDILNFFKWDIKIVSKHETEQVRATQVYFDERQAPQGKDRFHAQRQVKLSLWYIFYLQRINIYT